MSNVVKLIAIVLFLGSLPIPNAHAALGDNFFISDVYVEALDALPFKAERPIAREIKFVYADGSILTGFGGGTEFLFTTNLTDPDEIKKRATTQIQKSFPSVKLEHFKSSSELTKHVQTQSLDLAENLRIEDAKAERGQGPSVTNYEERLSLARSIDSTVALMNTYVAFVEVAETLSKKWNKKAADTLVEWIKKNTGAIGPGAPEGSVLHIDLIRVTKAKSFQLSSTTEIIVSAYLERKDHPSIHSTRGIRYVRFSRRERRKLEGEQPDGFVPINSARIDFDKLPQMKPLDSVTFGLFHGALANAVVKDIYTQLDGGSGQQLFLSHY